MTFVLTLLIFQSALGAFDTLYRHGIKESRPDKHAAKKELKLHAVRTCLYAFLFMTFAWLELKGNLAALLFLLLMLEVILVLSDFIIEDDPRHLPLFERVTHTVLAINFGVILGYLLPELYHWYLQPTGISIAYYGWLSWVISLFSLAAFTSGVKGWQRSSRLTSMDLSFDVFERYRGEKKSILVTGGSGFIGKRLVQALINLGHDVTVLTRDIPAAAQDMTGKVSFLNDLSKLNSENHFNIIINLAGEPLAKGRWTKKRKKQFVKSRIAMTAKLNTLITRLRRKPELLINGSAIGYYGPQDGTMLNEESNFTKSFSHHLCESWEHEANKIKEHNVRVCLLRIGVVLGQDGGPLNQLRLPFEFGCATQIGNGGQWMSWIHRDDLISMMLHLMANNTLKGPFNATAPTPVTNSDFTCILSRYLSTLVRIKIPSKVLSIIVGEMANEILITGQRVIPVNFQLSKFEFTYPELPQALEHLITAKVSD